MPGTLSFGTVGHRAGAQWRVGVLNAILRALAITGVIALLATTPVLVLDGQAVLSGLYWALMAPFVWVAYSRTLGFRVRLSCMLAACYAVAIAIGVSERRVPELAVYLFAISTMAALLGGVRWGTIWLGLCGLTLVALGVANVTGALGPAPASAIDPALAGNWITLGCNWALFAVSLSISIWVVISHLERSLERERVLSDELRKHVQQVQDASAARLAAEARLVQAQKLEVVGKLTGGIAHDFNNLLTAITLAADAARRHASSAAKVEASLSIVQDAALQASRLTQQLLSFSRRAVVEPRPCDVSELVRGSERVAGRLLPPQISLVLELAPAPVCAVVDDVQLQQVLLNLIVNARDAIGDASGVITVRTRVEGALAVLEVADTGTGIDEAVRAHIFEPFFTTKPSGRGTGLGLAVVASIVEQHRGQVRVESERGRGSTLTVVFPQHAGAIEHGELPEAANAGGSERVLVVDDDGAVREGICTALRDAGYQVSDAPGASAALALLRTQPEIALVIADLVMPEVGGAELARAVREQHPGARVLFCSAFVDDDQLQRLAADPTVELLQKPFARVQLLAKVRSALERTA